MGSFLPESNDLQHVREVHTVQPLRETFPALGEQAGGSRFSCDGIMAGQIARLADVVCVSYYSMELYGLLAEH